MATVIFLSGLVFSIVLMRHNGGEESRQATEVMLTCAFIAAGLLGWRQATNMVRSAIQNGKTERDDNGISEEPSPLPVAEP